MSALSPTSPLQGSRYQILRTLGQGGFGITYQARDALLQRTVVIKELFPQGSVRTATGLQLPGNLSPEYFSTMLRSFVEEARALARFSSEHVVRVQDVFQDRDTAYIVMDFIEGRTLMQRLRDEGPLNPETALRMARQLAGALDVVHRAGLLHRDIKPDNIFLTRDDTPVLIDFGAARPYTPDQQIEMSVVLTHGFAPLEQYAQTGTFGPYTDLYALAATLLFAITAKVPPVPVARLQGEAPLPVMDPTYPPGLRRAIDQGLQIQPAQRPQTAEAFLALLQGGREDYGALELAEELQRQRLASPAVSESAFGRMWAQTLLALWARREGRLPGLATPDDLEASLKRSLDLLPLLQEGLLLVFGDLRLAAEELARLIPGVVRALHDRPGELPEFALAVEALAALPKPVHLPTPDKVWRAPSTNRSQRPPLPALSAKFQGFQSLELAAADVVQLGFADPVHVLWTLSTSGRFQAFGSGRGTRLLDLSGTSAAAADGTGLYTGTHGGKVRRWDFHGQAMDEALNLAFVPVRLAAHQGTLAAAGREGELLVGKNGEVRTVQVAQLVGREADLQALHFSADGQLLLWQDAAAVTLLRVQTLKVLRTLTLPGAPVTAAALSQDGQRAATSHGARVLLWDVVSGRETGAFAAPWDVQTLFFNPGGRMLGVLGDELLLYDVQSGQPLAAHPAPGGRGLRASISRDGRMLAVAGLHRVDLLHLAPVQDQTLPDLQPPMKPTVPPVSTRPVSVSPAPPSPAPVTSPESITPPVPGPGGGPPPLTNGFHAAAALLTSRTTAAPSDVALGTAGTEPYQEHVLPLQPQTDLLRRSAPDLAALMEAVVQAEGPVHRHEVFRRVAIAHGVGKVGSRIAAALEQVLQKAVQNGQVVQRGDFLWPPGMTRPPVRDRAGLPHRSVDLVCDEELQEAVRLVQSMYSYQFPDTQVVTVARLLGFARLTKTTRDRIVALMQRTHA
ncbi:DUF3320 domain-containing protein [Deinococcus sp. SDU3-2]|uniref:DUF3320 domain-containing protein n=1 Tax=Deinococcus terrestris TaxID=2651870 RepID=A0A7X1NXV8_9DEIO|nr:DUF3320 domain-containing protein [Deinococcus terrestris]MPY67728.1 DUF3320 domain-containing protein [Deinococcus terrestris]